MTKGSDDKKIGGIRSTKETRSIEGTGVIEGSESIGGVTSVKGASSVGSVKGSGQVARASSTKILSAKERDKIFSVIREEADKLVGEGILPSSKKDIAKSAVMMAIDSALVEDEDGTAAKGKGAKSASSLKKK
jgi:hypothetical protein